MALDQWATMLGQVAAGSLAGKQMAQQEADQESQRREQQTLSMIPLLQQQAEQQRSAQIEPWKVLAPHISQMTPDAQAQFLTGYSHAAGAPPPSPNWQGVASSFDADSPVRRLLTQIGGGAPQQPTPGAYPYGLPRDVAPTAGGAPGGVPGAGVTPASAPGGVPAGPQRPIVTGPGGAQFTLGPDQKQVALARSEVARIAPRFGGKDLSPEFRSGATDAVKLANQQIDAGDLEGARQTIARLQSMEAEIPRQQSAGGAGRYAGLSRRYDAKLKEFQTRAVGGSSAYAGVHALREMEKEATQIAQEHPEIPIAGMDTLAGYGPQIDEMDQRFQQAMALRTKKDRSPAEDKQLADLDRQWQGTAQDLHDSLRYGVAPERKGQVLTAIRQWIAMQAPKDRTPQNVAAQLTAMGAPDMAKLVTERGLNLGGAEAEKQTISLLKGLPQFMRPGTPDAVRQKYASELLAQSTLAGHAISLDPAQLVRPSLKDIKGTTENRAANDTHLKSLEELRRLKAQNAVEIQGGKWAGSLLDLQIKGAKRDQALGLFDPALIRSVAIHRMSAAQHDTNAASALYSKWLSSNARFLTDAFDPDYYLNQTPAWRQAHPLDDITQRGLRLYSDWKTKDAAAQKLFDRIPKDQEKQGKDRMLRMQGAGALGNTTAAGGTVTQPAALAPGEVQHVQRALNQGVFDQWMSSPALQNPSMRERAKRAYQQITGHPWTGAR